MKTKTFFLVVFYFCTEFLFSQNPELVKDITPIYGSSPGNFAVLNNKILFAANSYTTGSSPNRELYVTDGTAVGTQLLKDIIVGNTGSSPENLIALNGKVYFVVSDTTGGTLIFRPWVTDGTAAGTYPLFTNPILSIANPAINKASDTFVLLNGLVYFISNQANPATDSVIYRTDGTQAGTVPFINLPNNNVNIKNAIGGLMIYNDKLVFSATSNGSAIYDLYQYDFGLNQSVLIKNDVQVYGQYSYKVYQNKLYFTGGSQANFINNAEPWITDGTAAGTFEISNLQPQVSVGSDANSYKILNNKLYFIARPYPFSNNSALFVIDSIVGSTTITEVAPIGNLATPTNTDYLNLIGNKFYFAGSNAISGTEPWISDGTTAGTTIIKDIQPGNGPSNPQFFIEYCNAIYFTASNPATGQAQVLYKTDGTSAGTTLIPGLFSNPTVVGGAVKSKIVLGNKLYFSTQFDVNIGEELYSYNAQCALAINQVEVIEKVKIYPNPSIDGMFTIENTSEICKITAFDLLGKEILVEKIASKTYKINNSYGIYLVKIIDDTGRSQILKVIISK